MQNRTIAGMLLLSIVLFSCQNDEEASPASIVGKWRGTLAEIEVRPFGVPLPLSRKDDTFDTEIEFKADGTLVIYGDAQPVEGTWQMVKRELTIDIDFTVAGFALTGIYTIEELTQTNLKFYLEKENQTITDPDSGQSITGDVKVSLHFERM